ncbi:uncharacterized protein LOC124872865 [Girardinichthys multiradiatus]|uniref:uncharacterized protein LOC124872854 n=1 Tax=Girardinichthys multiradiatus TaxID=208333 RepID=UPI001FAD2400|nr:uncharacterized protein LOC124872854 [Girardinichthys multiradiatus]XP_047229227.1 uncharacterized protein LOC124872865 [Girardinichthys multiradiatus]
MSHNESGDVVVGMPSEKPLLILISHCREMKQQEARLRIITLLLLLSCAALFVFTNCTDLTRAPMAPVSSSAYSAQQNLCPAGDQSTTSTPTTAPSTASPLRIALSSIVESNLIGRPYMNWTVEFGGDDGTYNSDSRAIVIPVTGHYFVYMRFLLHLCETVENEDLKNFRVKLQKWNEGYQQIVDLTEARDSGKCSEERSRTVFMGQLFDLLKGDHLKVLIYEGYELIHKSSFGAFWT